MEVSIADPGPIFPIVGRAMDSARHGRMRTALRSRKKAPANGGQGGYVDGYVALEEGGYIFGNFHPRPGQPVVCRAKHGLITGARENGSPNRCKRCDVWKLIAPSQIYAFPALSMIGRAEDALISSGEEIIAM